MGTVHKEITGKTKIQYLYLLVNAEVDPNKSALNSAQWQEGQAVMTSIATGIRAYAAEKGPKGALPTSIIGTGKTSLGFTEADLDGVYFQASDFSMVVTSLNPLTFTISCTPTRPNAPKNPKTVTLDQSRNWTPPLPEPNSISERQPLPYDKVKQF